MRVDPLDYSGAVDADFRAQKNAHGGTQRGAQETTARDAPS